MAAATLVLPITIPVGLLACQQTTIVSASLLKPSPPSSVKKGVLFPEGGGQPTDIGTLISEDGFTWDVEFVKRHGGVAVHYVKLAEDVGDVPSTFAPESSLKLPTVTWSPTPWPSPAYIDLPRPLTPAEVIQVQDEVNRNVFEARRVHVEVDDLHPGPMGIDSGDAEASSRELERGLSSDYTGSVHRMVIIDDVDRTPCSVPIPGPDVLVFFRALTALLPRRAAPAEPSFWRLVAPRADRKCQSASRSSWTRASDGRSASRISSASWQACWVVSLWRKWQWRAAGGEGEWVRCISRTDDSPTAQAFLQAVTLAFAAAHVTEHTDTPQRYTFLLVSSPSSQTSSSTTVAMLFGYREKRVKVIGDELKKQFKTLKGGGKGIRWSGKFAGVWLADREGKAASALLSQSLWPQP
ncbi:hypothetical protein BJV78DRAFT_1152063 [Lactifluus subvellereus]|nr:hypothetical protein BJV78DRAFT_1152063 [Lactifluus subvellereus]